MDALADVCERIAERSSRLKKVAILAEYLTSLDFADLRRAVHFLCCGPLFDARSSVQTLFGDATPERPALAIGSATLREAAIAATGWDAETVRLCAREVGDTGETIGLLLSDRSAAEPMSLSRAEDLYGSIYRARTAAEKIQILKQAFQTYRPLTIKYFVKVFSGNLRIGLQAKMVEEAIAASTGASLDELRAAQNRLGNLAEVAVAARAGELHRIEATLFHPMEFMLAKPLEDAGLLDDASQWIVEDKFDGIRSQVHFANGRVAIYTRGLEDSTAAFPEIEAAFARLPGSGVIDGEILAWREGRALAFARLQQRLARKRVTAELTQSTPLIFMAYDVLNLDGSMVVDRPIENRQEALNSRMTGRDILLSARHEAASAGDLNRLFEDARLRGNEGLLLKRKGSLYESGKRSGAWLKLKRAYATLDVAITAAEQGTGRRATVLSDYTFGVRSGDGFVNVGKAYSGLTDEEVRELTRVLRSISVEKFGRVVLVRPQVVLEVAFDGVQKSARHKGGYALRFPRIVRWRKDKKVEECDDIDRVRTLYESSMNLTASHE